MIMTDEESVVLIMEMTNSYILLDKENKKSGENFFFSDFFYIFALNGEKNIFREG